MLAVLSLASRPLSQAQSSKQASVEAGLVDNGPYTFVYHEFTGDYGRNGAMFSGLTDALRRHGIFTTRSIGIFFDDPKTVRAEALRSICGVVIDEKDWSRIEGLDRWFKIQHIPRAKRIVAEYPITGPQSYAEGGARCYPALLAYAKSKGYTPFNSFEVYDPSAGKILYVACLTELETLRPPARASSRSAKIAAPEWPDADWRVSTPEAQGMSSRKLVQMLDSLCTYFDLDDIDSLLIARHGKIVTEVYFFPNEPDRRHVLHSVTKSVLGTLVGAAIQKGVIHGIDDLVLDYFPQESFAGMDPGKRSMTIGALLNMTSGLDFQEFPLNGDRNTHFRMLQSPDWGRFALGLPMAVKPGARFNYSDGDVSILSDVLTKATGMNAREFASGSLFGPLGITGVQWGEDPKGNTMGNDGLLLTTRDMARIGYLYLRDGVWKGRRILPEGWTRDVLLKAVKTNWPLPFYGRLWWTDWSRSFFSANGSGGQLILVMPREDIVAVVTQQHPMSLETPDFIEVAHELIIPAIKSERPLPADGEAQNALAERVARFSAPPRGAAPIPPETASRVSGRLIALDANPLGMRNARLTFHSNVSTLELSFDDSSFSIPIGLDGVYLKSPPTGKGVYASRGRWEDERTFVVESRILEGDFHEELRLAFEKDRVTVTYVVSDVFWRTFTFAGRLAR